MNKEEAEESRHEEMKVKSSDGVAGIGMPVSCGLTETLSRSFPFACRCHRLSDAELEFLLCVRYRMKGPHFVCAHVGTRSYDEYEYPPLKRFALHLHARSFFVGYLREWEE
ncbi:unnamed protein product [Sphagnum balticum]